MDIKQAEQILIGSVLKHGKQAAALVIPDLVPSKFIYDEKGFGIDHSLIWSKISQSFLQNRSDPTIAGVSYREDYLHQLVNDLENKHGIFKFDPNTLLEFADVVYKSGTIYRTIKNATAVSKLGSSEDVFESHVSSISSLNEWLADIIETFQVETQTNEGYKHTSDIIPSVIDKWERQYAGEQLVLLPVGLPSFLSSQLFPRGQLSVLHGMSGTGKSSLLLLVLLGTAIGLKSNGVQGCVALNSLEMDEEELISRAASLLAGIDYTRLIGGKAPLETWELEKLIDWTEFVGTLPLFIDDSNLLTTDVLRYQALSLHASEHGPLYQLGTDYTELFMDETENKEQRIEKVARNHFAIARLLDCSVLMVSQSTYGNNRGKYYIAGLNGLRWSRGATMAANIIVEVINYPAMESNGVDFNTPEEMDPYHAWIQIQKYRGGQTGQFPLKWEGNYTRYFDPELFTKKEDSLVFEHLLELPEAKRLVEKWRYVR